MTKPLTDNIGDRIGDRIVAFDPVKVVAAASGLVAGVYANSAAVGIGPVDALYRSCFVATIVLVAPRARRWTWLFIAVLAAATTADLIAQVLCIAATLAAIASLFEAKRRRLMGAVIAAVAMPSLLIQGTDPISRVSGSEGRDPFGSSTVVMLVALAPLMASVWTHSSRRRRRLVRTRVGYAIAIVSLIGFVTTALVMVARSDANEAMATSLAASEFAVDGDLDATTRALARASDEWGRANSILTGPWMVPGRLIPLVGQNLSALQAMTGEGRSVTAASALLAGELEDIELVDDGAVNVQAIDGLTPVVDLVAASATAAESRLQRVESGWLFRPVARRLDQANTKIPNAAARASAGAEALRDVIRILSSNDRQSILVMVTTPAEARGAGGFVGHWAEIAAVNGDLRLTNQLRSRELNELLTSKAVTLTAPVDYTRRYSRFAVEEHIQDVTISPDFPSVAAVATNLYLEATGRRPAAVLMIDPFVIDDLLAFTGPIEIEDGRTIATGAAADELLSRQYERFDGNDDSREALLEQLTGDMITELLSGPPAALDLARALYPRFEEGRAAIWFAEGTGDLNELGLSGQFPTIDSDEDLFAVVHQNAGQNKIDTYLRRGLDVVTEVGSDGTVSHAARLLLHNGAPADGLSDAVIGSNDQGLAPGTNRMMISIYSPLDLEAATIDGKPWPVETQEEFGIFVYSMVLSIGPGESLIVDLDLSGEIALSDRYELIVPAQPLVNPDAVSWTIGDRVAFDGLLRRDERFVERLESLAGAS